MSRITLSAKLTLENGSFIVEVLELGQMTHADTLEGVLGDIIPMVVDYLEVLREGKPAKYAELLKLLGGDPADHPVPEISINVDTGNVVKNVPSITTTSAKSATTGGAASNLPAS